MTDLPTKEARARSLLSRLDELDVVLSVDFNGRLAIDAPVGVLTDKLLPQLRANRDGLLALLRCKHQLSESDIDPLQSTSERCPWCGPVTLLDQPWGLSCDRCGRVAWVFSDRTMTRADYFDVAL